MSTMTKSAIADKYDVSMGTVNKKLKDAGIKSAGNAEPTGQRGRPALVFDAGEVAKVFGTKEK